MVDLLSFIKSLKLSWLSRILKSNSSWIKLLKTVVPDIYLIFQFGSTFASKIADRTCNLFWKEVIQYYAEFDKILIHTKEELASIPLWHNPSIVVAKKTVYYREWYLKGIRNIQDLLRTDGSVMSYQDFCHTYGMQPAITLYIGIVNAVKKKLGKYFIPLDQPYMSKTIKLLLSTKMNKPIYNTFIANIYSKPKSESKWDKDLDIAYLNWENIYTNCIKLTVDNKLRWFQFRIIYRILGTNSLLHKIGTRDSGLCDFCKLKNETILHLFLDCNITASFFNDIKRWLFNNFGLEASFDKETILFGNGSEIYFIQLIILLAKFHIYKSKMQNKLPSFDILKQEISKFHADEMYRLLLKDQNSLYDYRWLPFKYELE